MKSPNEHAAGLAWKKKARDRSFQMAAEIFQACSKPDLSTPNHYDPVAEMYRYAKRLEVEIGRLGEVIGKYQDTFARPRPQSGAAAPAPSADLLLTWLIAKNPSGAWDASIALVEAAIGHIRAGTAPAAPAPVPRVNLEMIKDRLDHIIIRCDQYGHDNIIRGLAIEAIQHITSWPAPGAASTGPVARKEGEA